MFFYKVKLNLYIETSLEKNYFWFCNPEAGENGWIIEYDYSFKHPEEINDNEIKYISKDEKEVENKEVFKNNKIFAKQQGSKWGFVDANENMIVDLF